MTTHHSFGGLEQAQQEETAAARRRLDQAEEFVAGYRSRLARMQEAFYEVAARHGAETAPGFIAELERVAEEGDHQVRRATQVIAGFRADLDEQAARHGDEREAFLRDREV
ncbi:hypothetical protein [Leifsonia sp. 22587]|uniref:hypothetical protein n=1 Tax=Leifsonia sp. 22587 TaxID=3453946 RepID=UPI003F869E8B